MHQALNETKRLQNIQHANLQGQTRTVQDRGCKKNFNAQTFSMGKEEAIDE